MATLSLFPTTPAEAIEADLVATFERFVKVSPPGRAPGRTGSIRSESAAIYRDMWRAFARYCGSNGLVLSSITGSDLQGFVESRGSVSEISDRYAWRLLRLIDRVVAFDAEERGIPANPAASSLLDNPRWKYANAAKNTALPQYLAPEDCRQLVVLLTGRLGGGSSEGTDWKDVRDRTAVAVQLGAGLTPGEARGLTVDQVVRDGGRRPGIPWKLRVPGNGNFPERDTPIAPWAGQLLAKWLEVRCGLRIDGPWVFPGTAGASRQWSKRGLEIACERVMKDAGIPVVKGGTFLLRHTFALRQLRAGKTDGDVARWLGVQDLSLLARYRRVLASPVAVV